MTLGPDAKRLLGGWRLVSALSDGKPSKTRGATPTGIIFYDATGWMSVQIMGAQPEIAGEQPTPDEALLVIQTYSSYFGTYSVDEVAKVVTHHRTGSVNPGWRGHVDYVRAYEFRGPDQVVLRPVNNKNELVWERLK